MIMRLIYAGIALLCATLGFADTITLKSGRVINGTYLGGTARTIRIDDGVNRSEEHTSELQSLRHLVCRLLLEKKKRPESHISRGQVCPRADSTVCIVASC